MSMNGDTSGEDHTITPAGNPVLSTTAKFNGSIYFDGSGDWLNVPHSSDFNLAAEEFTLDLWVRFSGLSTNQTFLSKHDNNNTDYEFAFLYHATNEVLQLNYSTNGTAVSNVVSTSTWVPTLNTWYHVAIVRTGNNIQFYIDGNKLGTDVAFNNTFFSSSTDQKIGAGTSGGAYVNRMYGYIDELRFSKGIARWTSNFTPESGPYTT